MMWPRCFCRDQAGAPEEAAFWEDCWAVCWVEEDKSYLKNASNPSGMSALSRCPLLLCRFVLFAGCLVKIINQTFTIFKQAQPTRHPHPHSPFTFHWAFSLPIQFATIFLFQFWANSFTLERPVCYIRTHLIKASKCSWLCCPANWRGPWTLIPIFEMGSSNYAVK